MTVTSRDLRALPKGQGIRAQHYGADVPSEAVSPRIAVENAWRPITEHQKDGSWIWAIMDGIHGPTGKPYEPVLVRWQNGRWFEPNDHEGCSDRFWDLSYFVPLPTSLSQ